MTGIVQMVLGCAAVLGTGPDPEPGPAPNARSAPRSPTTVRTRLVGVVREAGTRRPLSGVVVLAFPAPAGVEPGPTEPPPPDRLPPWIRRAESDDDGGFVLADLPPGLTHVAILADGYVREDRIERITEPPEKPLRLFLRADADAAYRTVVRTRLAPPESPASHELEIEELRNLPGTQGDPLRGLQSLPGLARAPMGLGLLSIRGATPTDSATYLDGHALPRPFHYGGIAAVYDPGALDGVRYIPGNFDARYGDAVAGIVDLRPRGPRRDGHHGYANLDMISAGARVEGPVGRGAYSIGARRGYVDLLFNLLPDDVDLPFQLSPRYYDYQAQIDAPVGGGTLTTRIFGAGDDLRVSPGEAVAFAFSLRTHFHRADIVYRRREGPWRFLVSPSVRAERAVNEGLSVIDADRTDAVFSGRAELARRLTTRTEIVVGTETVAGRYWAHSDTDPGETETDTYSRIALYVIGDIGLGPRVQLVPSARFTIYGGPNTYTTADPRGRMNWTVTDRLRLFAGLGLHSQFRAFERQAVFNPLSGGRISGALAALLPRVSLAPLDPGPRSAIFQHPQRATQASAGVERRFGTDVSARITGFYRGVWCVSRRAVFPPCERAYGGELLIRKPLTGRLFGWISYTLMRSEFWREPTLPGSGAIPSSFDQRHILALVAVRRLPRNWQIGGRWRLVSGTPYTPVLPGPFDASDGRYFSRNGSVNSARFPVFHQLDLRVDRRFILDRATVSLYFDVQNVYNRENVEGWVYGYDFRSKVAMTWLPILPSLGIRVDF